MTGDAAQWTGFGQCPRAWDFDLCSGLLRAAPLTARIQTNLLDYFPSPGPLTP